MTQSQIHARSYHMSQREESKTDLDDLEVLNQFKDIWKRKQYRMLPTPITSYLRRDRRVSSTAQCLWVFLFEQVYFEENWQLVISKAKVMEIAEEFGRCIKSISRLLNVLTKLGYLKKGGNEFIYQVRFPTDAVNEILEKDDDREVAKSKLKQPRKNSDKNVQGHGAVQPQKTKMSICVDKNVLYTFNNINIKNNNNNALKPKLGVTPATDSSPPVVVSDINNNTDADLEFAKTKVEELNQKIKAETHSLPGLSSQQREVVFKRIKSLDVKRFNLNARITEVETKRIRRAEKAVSEKYWQDDAKQMYLHPGERKLTEFQYHSLRKQLSQFGYDPGKLNRLTNELIFEIRFGSLRQSNRNQATMSIEHGINIGIKLLRENRWRTPADMDNLKKLQSGGV